MDQLCDVEVGTHPRPFWRDRNKNMIVCQHHKDQYMERAEEFGPFDWELVDIADEPRDLISNAIAAIDMVMIAHERHMGNHDLACLISAKNQLKVMQNHRVQRQSEDRSNLVLNQKWTKALVNHINEYNFCVLCKNQPSHGHEFDCPIKAFVEE